jgi:D-alanyl-D-alanine carboxypeptidase/D-alanyl-D-alanine-endopeptidase (penicillin-binding protein 4)
MSLALSPMRTTARAAIAATLLAAMPAFGALPSTVGNAFTAAGIPLNAVAIVVQRVGAPSPLFTHQDDRPMNPASVMKLVTTFSALDLLGPDYRWRTEAYLGGAFVDGILAGNLILKGYGDPKITIEQWQAFMAKLRAGGLETITGDLVIDRSYFKLPRHDAAAFDGEPLKPYNVGPDPLLVNFKSVRFAFAPNAAGDAVEMLVEPVLAPVGVGPPPALGRGECADWRGALRAAFANGTASARVQFSGRYPASCGDRDWYIALLDAPHYAHAMFATYFALAGGTFRGGLIEGRVPFGATPFATLESPPLYDIVRDVNKLSNNVMARQIFLTLGATSHKPPVSTAEAIDTIQRWLQRRKLALPGLVMENGSGLSRNERITAGGLANLLLAADASAVRDEFASSLAVAAVDGTVARRFANGSVAGQALLKTGSLDQVRALAGYVIGAEGERWIVVALINHPNAANGARALDNLVQWVYRDGPKWQPDKEPPAPPPAATKPRPAEKKAAKPRR